MGRGNASPILVTSHVARDFLQNSAYFNTPAKVVWEYVSNALDAAKETLPVTVAVDITNRWITIADDGQGMSREELVAFFQMHGENTYRKRGKRVRGRFGTGKSAAFGIANCLEIDTAQSGLRNVVELHRGDIESASSGEAFPVRHIVSNERTTQSDGTTIRITELQLRKIDVESVMAYIERHLGRYQQRATVLINEHPCEFKEPAHVDEFRRPAPEDVARHLGPVELLVRVSPVPLPEENVGIDVLSHGIWHGATLAGIERRERANYLFGEIEVPLLENGNWDIPAFDNTRNNTLNPSNPVVAVLYGWIGEELEEVRQLLLERERKRRQSEQAKQLSREADLIAQMINQDFAQLEMELEIARRVARRSGGRATDESPDPEGQQLPGSGDVETPWVETGQDHGDGKRGSGPIGGGDTVRPGPTLREGSGLGSPKAASEGRAKRRRGIFTIAFENATEEKARSRYDADSKTIHVNLDHPQIARALAAAANQVDSPIFRDLCAEVALVEYSLALSYERLERDEYLDAEEALWDVSRAVSRVSRLIASLPRR